MSHRLMRELLSCRRQVAASEVLPAVATQFPPHKDVLMKVTVRLAAADKGGWINVPITVAIIGVAVPKIINLHEKNVSTPDYVPAILAAAVCIAADNALAKFL